MCARQAERERERERGIDGVGNVCLCCLFIRFNVCSPGSDIKHCVCLCVYVVCVCVCLFVCLINLTSVHPKVILDMNGVVFYDRL